MEWLCASGQNMFHLAQGKASSACLLGQSKSCHFPFLSCPSASQAQHEQCPFPHLLASGPALVEPVAGAVGRRGQGGVGHGGRGAYRGGAGRENVITRSSLLKVRHRLAGNRVHGGGVILGQGQC